MPGISSYGIDLLKKMNIRKKNADGVKPVRVFKFNRIPATADPENYFFPKVSEDSVTRTWITGNGNAETSLSSI